MAAAPLTAHSADTVKIGWNVADGKVCEYDFSDHTAAKMDSTTKAEGEDEKRQKSSMSAVFEGPVTVKRSDGGTAMEMHLKRTSIKPDTLPEDAKIQDTIDGTATFGTDGELSTDTGKNSYLYFVMVFNVPGMDLASGAPATADLMFPDEKMPLTGKGVYTLSGIDDINGRKCAVYDVKSALANDRTGHTEDSHFYVDIKGDMKCAFALDDGCLVYSKGTITTTIDAKMDLMGVKVKMNNEIVSNVDAELGGIK